MSPHSALPRGPRSALYQTLRAFVDPYGAMLGYLRTYGDPMTVPLLGFGTFVMTGDPEAIRAADIQRVAKKPEPNCILMDFTDSYGRYALRYWLTDLAVDDPTDSEVRAHIYAALYRAAIPLSIPAHAIFVTEDDAQDGPDHVDAHRTVAEVISPYTRTGRVDSTFYSTASMLRTIELIVGLYPLTQFDAYATPMLAAFTNKPNYTPFNAVPNQIPLTEGITTAPACGLDTLGLTGAAATCTAHRS